MKNKFIMLFMVLGIITVGIYSCSDQEVLEIQAEVETTVEAEDEMQAAKRKLYQACWDEWGRSSRDCKGGGLCNFEDCWGWQDPCCGRPAPIVEDEEVEDACYIRIELSSNYDAEAEFIREQSPLYVDEDIVEDALDPDWNTLTIRADVYLFDESIGEEGGYKVPLVIN